LTTQSRKRESSAEQDLKETDSLRLGDNSDDNSPTARVILFDCDGRVKEFRESAIKLHHH
jgi:hypothetical protein